jgi:hypothetical protein
MSLHSKIKYWSGLFCAVLYFLILVSSCGGGSGGSSNVDIQKPLQGLLQFRFQQNLQDDGCLAENDCFLITEEEGDPAAWLAEIAEVSNMAVLHWDRSIPWLVFDAEVPIGNSRVEFYDARIDANLLKWINAFTVHFASLPASYLAVTPIHGERNRLERLRVNENLEVEITDICPDAAPGTEIQFQYNDVTGTVNGSFNLERSYTNFVLYLYEKLQPDYFAINVEINIFKELCPAKWNGMVDLYRSVYDTVRTEAHPKTKVFATVAFQNLLDYELENCQSPLEFEECTEEPTPPSYQIPDPVSCFPLDLSAISDLDQGNRLEILALSFYPDSMLMGVGTDNVINVYPEDWDGSSTCLMRAPTLPFVDPVAALDRFGWEKPVAIAELGARSCRTLQFFNDGETRFLTQPPGDPVSQTFWLNHFLESARERQFEFYVQVYLKDYDPIGPWTVNQGILSENLYNIFNIFPCMGLYEENGQTKENVTDTWLNELP